MQLELPIRWTETDKDKQDKEDLIRGDYAERKVKHTYGRLLIPSEEIGSYYDIDEHNTMIHDKFGKLYCVQIPLDHFKKIMTEVTGKAIMAITARTEASSIPQNPQQRRKPRSDEDDILMD